MGYVGAPLNAKKNFRSSGILFWINSQFHSTEKIPEDTFGLKNAFIHLEISFGEIPPFGKFFFSKKYSNSFSIQISMSKNERREPFG